MASEPLNLARDGQEYGSCPPEEIAARVASGEVLSTDYYWRPGMKGWELVSALLSPRRPLPFARPADKDANFIDDLFSRESKVKGLQLLWDKLADSPRACLVSEADMAAIAKQVGYDVRQRCKAELKQWYRQALAAYLSDRLFSPDEQADLGNLALTFGFSSEDALALHRTEFESYFNVGAMTCLMRPGSTEEKVRQLALLAKEVPLPPAVVAEVRTRALRVYFEGLYRQNLVKEEDAQLLDPEFAATLRGMASQHGLDLAAVFPDLSAQITQSADLWRLYRAPFTTIASGRELGSEPCYWERDIRLFQRKRVTVRRSYGGFSSSVRLFGGLRYRVGSYDVQRETEEQLVQVDTGRLIFTANRVIFDGNVKNLTFKHAKVLEVVAYADAVVISRETGPDLICMLPDRTLEAAVLLRRLVRQAKG